MQKYPAPNCNRFRTRRAIRRSVLRPTLACRRTRIVSPSTFNRIASKMKIRTQERHSAS